MIYHAEARDALQGILGRLKHMRKRVGSFGDINPPGDMRLAIFSGSEKIFLVYKWPTPEPPFVAVLVELPGIGVRRSPAV